MTEDAPTDTIPQIRTKDMASGMLTERFRLCINRNSLHVQTVLWCFPSNKLNAIVAQIIVFLKDVKYMFDSGVIKVNCDFSVAFVNLKQMQLFSHSALQLSFLKQVPFLM